jgi:formyltetrahydrofolate-dependent phosphoribosylglycinamide formyltransferase
LAVLISGGGRTLVNLQHRIAEGKLNARIDPVVSSRGDMAGVARSRELGLRTLVIEHKVLDDEVFDQRITEVVGDTDLICMAGFLSLWRFPEDFYGRVINIHPALLPEFGGKGMYGHHVHEAVLSAGKRESGCTVHFCDNEYDHGPIILQRRVPVRPDDTPDELAARVFEQECIAYPETVRLFCENRIRLAGREVTILD